MYIFEESSFLYFESTLLNILEFPTRIQENISYPELTPTKPLHDLTKKNVRFHWGQEQEEAFQQVKDRLCSDNLHMPYDTSLDTRLFIDSSPVGTRATVTQKHHIDNENDVWRPVYYTSRAWTPAEAGYDQIEHESNSILKGMHMNKIYTLGTHIEVVTDHAPLLPAYHTLNATKHLRVDRRRTKFLPFWHNVVYGPGINTAQVTHLLIQTSLKKKELTGLLRMTFSSSRSYRTISLKPSLWRF